MESAFLCNEEQEEAAGRSPLTNKLLALGETVTDVLDYDEDPEVAIAVANIPLQLEDVEMLEADPLLGF